MKFVVIPPEQIERGRTLYEGTAIPQQDIAALLGISKRTLQRRINEWGWTKRSARFAGLAAEGREQAEKIAAFAEPHIATLESRTLIDRVHAAVEREIVAIDAVLARVQSVQLRSSDAERAARTLAALVKTLREVVALKREERADLDGGDSSEDEFRDLDDFRRELAERLDRLQRSGRAS